MDAFDERPAAAAERLVRHARAAPSIRDNPSLVLHRTAVQLRVAEPDRNLAFGARRRIAAVHEIPADRLGKITPDRARRGFGGVRCADQGTHGLDRIIAFHDERNDWSRGEVLDQTAEKRLALVLGVMLLRRIGGRLDHLDTDDGKPPALKTREDLADEAARDRVGFRKDKCAFH